MGAGSNDYRPSLFVITTMNGGFSLFDALLLATDGLTDTMPRLACGRS
jgi:hypothetical protein